MVQRPSNNISIILGIAKFSDQEKLENMRCCALFGIMPKEEKQYATAMQNRLVQT